ncbi:MAG: lamin tail domain-containing protein [Rubrivivax sp.]
MNRPLRALAAALSVLLAGAAQAQVQITEYMYNGADGTGEYIEFTNLGSTALNFAGWSFDDSSRTPGSVSLSGFGIVAAGQSVILTEASASAFRAAWGLSATVAVVGDNSNNLGRSDEINLYDASGTLVDRLTYGDQSFAGTVRAQNVSANPGTLAALQPQAIGTAWVASAAGDLYGSHASTLGDIGNPGVFALAPVPEPASLALLLAGLGIVGVAARRRA